MIRAYIPWYLVFNYLVFAFVACLGALQLAKAYRTGAGRGRYALAWAILIGAFLGFYAFAPELLTPGPAGGELTFLFGGVALLTAVLTRAGLADRQDFRGCRFTQMHADSICEDQRAGSSPASPRAEAGERKSEDQQLVVPHLKIEVYYLLAGFSLAVVLFDAPLFHLLNGLARRTPLIDVPVQFFMNDYVVPTALVLALLSLWFAGRTADERAAFQRTGLRALLALALASIVLKLINEVYFRPRPFTFDDSVRLLFYHPSDSSMPSNSATVCFALAASVWLRQKQWGGVMLALAAGMTLSRIVGGVHTPADIVVGAWLGGLSAWLIHRMSRLDSLVNAAIGLAQRLGLA